jgi:hypothetical protein
MTMEVSATVEVDVVADNKTAAGEKAEEWFEGAQVDVKDKREHVYGSLSLSVVGSPENVRLAE